MANARTRAHHLHVTGLGAALVAERVLVGDRTLADIGDDLHVRVRMRGEAGVRRDLVVVPDAQAPMADVVRVIVAGKREVMLRLQPAMVGAAELCEWFQFNHWSDPCLYVFDSAGRADRAPLVPEFRSGVPATVDVEHRTRHEG